MNLIINNPAVQMALMDSHQHHSHGNIDGKVVLAGLIVFSVIFLISGVITILTYKTKHNRFRDPFWEYYFASSNLILMLINWCGVIIYSCVIFYYLTFIVYKLLI